MGLAVWAWAWSLYTQSSQSILCIFFDSNSSRPLIQQRARRSSKSHHRILDPTGSACIIIDSPQGTAVSANINVRFLLHATHTISRRCGLAVEQHCWLAAPSERSLAVRVIQNLARSRIAVAWGDASPLTWVDIVITASLKTSFVGLVWAVRKESFAIAEVRSWKTTTCSCVQSQALYYQHIRISQRQLQ